MMMDNDMPKAMGFLQAYKQGMSEYSQAGEQIPDLRLQNKYAQEFGGPLIEEKLVQGIPVGEDPIFPMGQEEFSDYVRGRLEQRKGFNPPLPEEIRRRIPAVRAKFGLV